MTKIAQNVQEVYSKKLHAKVMDLMFGEEIDKEKSREVAQAVRNAFDQACQDQDIIEA